MSDKDFWQEIFRALRIIELAIQRRWLKPEQAESESSTEKEDAARNL